MIQSCYKRQCDVKDNSDVTHSINGKIKISKSRVICRYDARATHLRTHKDDMASPFLLIECSNYYEFVLFCSEEVHDPAIAINDSKEVP